MFEGKGKGKGKGKGIGGDNGGGGAEGRRGGGAEVCIIIMAWSGAEGGQEVKGLDYYHRVHVLNCTRMKELFDVVICEGIGFAFPWKKIDCHTLQD